MCTCVRLSPQELSALQCDVCILVFSVTDRRSFHRTAQLRLLLRESQPQTPIILVGNKSDLVRSREISSEGRWREGHWPVLRTCRTCVLWLDEGTGYGHSIYITLHLHLALQQQKILSQASVKLLTRLFNLQTKANYYSLYYHSNPFHFVFFNLYCCAYVVEARELFLTGRHRGVWYPDVTIIHPWCLISCVRRDKQ